MAIRYDGYPCADKKSGRELFIDEIQERINGTHEDALKAVEWLERIKPIDPMFNNGHVDEYLNSLIEDEDDDFDYEKEMQKPYKLNKLWNEMIQVIINQE
jgi:hypothetical protein